MIDPQVDLATIEDGMARAKWILPAPTEPPPLMTRLKLPARESSVAAHSP